VYVGVLLKGIALLFAYVWSGCSVCVCVFFLGGGGRGGVSRAERMCDIGEKFLVQQTVVSNCGLRYLAINS
jgi:hypothetical protein